MLLIGTSVVLLIWLAALWISDPARFYLPVLAPPSVKTPDRKR